MKHYTGCDAHKKYSVFIGSSIAIESVGDWYMLARPSSKIAFMPLSPSTGLRLKKKRIRSVIKEDHAMQILKTLPGVGPILSITIALEMGNVERFPTGEKFASYSGKAPRVSSSGGKTYCGKVRPDVNRYLKWAFTEAANAITAVGRHLAESTYRMLKNDEPYQGPFLYF